MSTETTPALALPLPDPVAGTLEVDVHALRAAFTGIDKHLNPAGDSGAQVITYDGTGRVAAVVDTINGHPRTSTMAYNGDGTIKTVTVAYLAATYVTAYTYSAGRVTGSTTTKATP